MVSGMAQICLCRAVVDRNSTDHSFIYKTKSKLKIRKTCIHIAKCFKFYKREGKTKELKQKHYELTGPASSGATLLPSGAS
jgi:hypothetical protein